MNAEIKKINKLLLTIISFLLYLSAFAAYHSLFYSWDEASKRSLSDTTISSFVFMTPILFGIYFVYLQKHTSKLKIFWYYVLSLFICSMVGVSLLMNYCQGEECLANIVLLASIFAYHVFLYIVFLVIRIFVK
jgi:hypothetical protein